MLKQQRKVFFHRNDLPEPKNTSEKWLNKNAIFEFEIEKTEKDDQAKEIRYIHNRLPEDTRNLRLKDIDNFHIKLNKMGQFRGDKFLLAKIKQGERIFEKIDFNKLNKRMELLKEAYVKRRYQVVSFDLSNDWRMVVGLGNESIYDTSITLHYIYGFPYIPGSAVKGVTRNWVITELFDSIEGDKTKGALSNKSFCEIFGSPKKSLTSEFRGRVIFFDALPVKAPTIDIDVINPHYGDYYSEKKDAQGNNLAPTDYLNPVPILFLTVKGGEYRFYLGIKDKDNLEIELGKYKGKILDVTIELLNWYWC